MPFSQAWSLMWSFKVTLLNADSTRKDCGIAHKSKNKMTLPQSGAFVEEPLLAGKPVAVMGAARGPGWSFSKSFSML
jgi:hypothetical protein